MGLASKIKNSNTAAPPPSVGSDASGYGYAPYGSSPPQQLPASSVAGNAPGYGYPPYGASPSRDQPQNFGQQPGAPSAPPDPQQYYGAAYPASHQSQHSESKPSASSVAGNAPGSGYPPYGTSPSRDHPQNYGQQPGAPSAPPDPQQYYGAAYPASYHSQHSESKPSAPSLYAVQGQTSPYGVQGQTPPYGQQGQTPPYGMQGYSLPYGEQVNTGAQPSYTYGGQGQGPYGEQAYAGAYGQPPGGGFGPPQYQQASYLPASTDMLTQKLLAIVQAKQLQAFYDQGRLQAIVQKVASINFAEIAAQWKISKELAYDLAPLALYDIVFYCDDSGSMAFEENGERIDDLKFILSKVSGIATLFDDDGIIVRFMNSDVNGDGIRNVTDVANLITKVRFSGMTPLGTNLDRKVIQPFVIRQAMSNMAKPVLAIAITDGEPSGEDRGTIRQVICRAKDALNRTRYGGGALAIQIAQVGKDAKTQQFLESLDKDPIVGKMIDCTSYYELEEAEFARKGVTLSPELWLLKMCVGAIDPDYDSKDD